MTIEPDPELECCEFCDFESAYRADEFFGEEGFQK